jgi:hypothetical protein
MDNVDDPLQREVFVTLDVKRGANDRARATPEESAVIGTAGGSEGMPDRR